MINPVVIGNAKIYNADCIEVMKTMPENSLDAIICDPPYLISFMNTRFDSQHKSLPGANEGQKMQEWHRRWVTEAYRILKPGGHLAAFGGDRTHHRLMSAMEDAGFELRQNCYYAFGSGFPKSQNASLALDRYFGETPDKIDRFRIDMKATGKNGATFNSCDVSKKYGESTNPISKQWTGYGTSLKPATEPVVIGKKPLPPIEELDAILIEISCFLFSDEVLCQRLNVNAKDAEKLSRFFLAQFVMASVSFAPNLATISSLAKTVFAHLVERISTLNDQELNLTSQRIAVGSAVTRLEVDKVLKMVTGVEGNLFAETEELLLEQAQTSIGLSIALSWKNILEDLWNRTRMSTTKTAIQVITELKTLRSLVTQNISATTMLNKETLQNGKLLNVQDVDALLKSAQIKLLMEEKIFATSNAFLLSEKKKPAVEIACIGRKPMIGTLAENLLTWGCGAMNLDACRVGSEVIDHKQSPLGRKGGYWNSDGRSLQENPLGRFPPHLLHDGSEVVKKCFPETGASKSGARGGTNPNPMDWGNNRSDGCIVKGHDDNGGSAARFFPSLPYDDEDCATIYYCAKASRTDRNEGCNGVIKTTTPSEKTGRTEGSIGLEGDSNNRGQTANPYANGGGVTYNNHVSVKPTSLMRWICRLLTPKGGTLLDPFMGSGSTLKAAILENFTCIGIEMDPDYFEIAKARVAHVSPETVFTPVVVKQVEKKQPANFDLFGEVA